MSVTIPQVNRIAVGSAASSETINTFMDNILVALSGLDTESDALKQKTDDVVVMLTAQTAAISSMISTLSSSISGMVETDAARADFYIQDYTTALANMLSTEYGQLTLPVVNTEDKLVAKDTEGNVWIPTDTKIEYAFATESPSVWTADPNGIKALDTDSATLWYRSDESEEEEYIWIKLTLPGNSNAVKDANTIIIHPFPEFGLDLYGITYTVAGVEHTADITYLTGWDGTKVCNLSKSRLFIPVAQVTEVILKLKANQDYFGLYKASVQLVDFDIAGSASIDFTPFNPQTINSITIEGKDQSNLAYISKRLDQNVVSLELTQSQAYSTPVVTGVSITWQ